MRARTAPATDGGSAGAADQHLPPPESSSIQGRGAKFPGSQPRRAASRVPSLSLKEFDVIALIRLNGHPVMVNSDLIEQIEETPDTVITLTSGNRLIVRDRMAEVQAKIIEFKRKIYAPDGGAR